MSNDLLIHATGLCALALNLVALVRTCERSLRMQSAVAGVIWALNNALLGAHTAAALSLLSAGRTATSASMLDSGERLRRALFAGFVLLALGVSAATWNGWPSALMTVASIVSTYAMFYLRGRPLRWSMLAVSALWMHNAWFHDSWEQMLANALTAAAALYGAWRIEGSRPAAAATAHAVIDCAQVLPQERRDADPATDPPPQRQR
ncbi:hypothetical protein BURC_03681 [Burkholderiaceae bacterium]|nr:hypothetical protein BURC_03681 [Burkholderiaceae bacterium]